MDEVHVKKEPESPERDPGGDYVEHYAYQEQFGDVVIKSEIDIEEHPLELENFPSFDDSIEGDPLAIDGEPHEASPGRQRQRASGPKNGAHQCPYCGRTFQSTVKVRRHCQLSHGHPASVPLPAVPPGSKPRLPHPCPECNDKFATLQGLRIHQRFSHPFRCHICSRCFSDAQSLGSHVRLIHDADCDTEAEPLLIAQPPEEKPPEPKQKLICTFCHNEFSSARLLETHRCPSVKKKDSGIVVEITPEVDKRETVMYPVEKYPYQCRRCLSTFLSIEDVTQHVWDIHHANVLYSDWLLESGVAPGGVNAEKYKLFQCGFCRKPFSTKEKVKSHFFQVHASCVESGCIVAEEGCIISPDRHRYVRTTLETGGSTSSVTLKGVQYLSMPFGLKQKKLKGKDSGKSSGKLATTTCGPLVAQTASKTIVCVAKPIAVSVSSAVKAITSVAKIDKNVTTSAAKTTAKTTASAVKTVAKTTASSAKATSGPVHTIVQPVASTAKTTVIAMLSPTISSVTALPLPVSSSSVGVAESVPKTSRIVSVTSAADGIDPTPVLTAINPSSAPCTVTSNTTGASADMQRFDSGAVVNSADCDEGKLEVFQCAICLIPFPRKDLVTKHFRECHPSLLPSKTALYQLHSINKPRPIYPKSNGTMPFYQCTVCSLIFLHKELAVEHFGIQHPEKPMRLVEVAQSQVVVSPTMTPTTLMLGRIDKAGISVTRKVVDGAGNVLDTGKPDVNTLTTDCKVTNSNTSPMVSNRVIEVRGEEDEGDKTLVVNSSMGTLGKIAVSSDKVVVAKGGSSSIVKKLPEKLASTEVPKSPKKVLFACSTCGQRFISNIAAKEHIALEHPPSVPTTYRCSHCEEPFGSEKEAKEHVVAMHAKDHMVERHAVEAREVLVNADAVQPSFQCSLCSHSFLSRPALRQHIRQVHSHNEGVPCVLCKQSMPNHSALAEHLKAKHLEQLKMVVETKPVGTSSMVLRMPSPVLQDSQPVAGCSGQTVVVSSQQTNGCIPVPVTVQPVIVNQQALMRQGEVKSKDMSAEDSPPPGKKQFTLQVKGIEAMGSGISQQESRQTSVLSGSEVSAGGDSTTQKKEVPLANGRLVIPSNMQLLRRNSHPSAESQEGGCVDAEQLTAVTAENSLNDLLCMEQNLSVSDDDDDGCENSNQGGIQTRDTGGQEREISSPVTVVPLQVNNILKKLNVAELGMGQKNPEQNSVVARASSQETQAEPNKTLELLRCYEENEGLNLQRLQLPSSSSESVFQIITNEPGSSYHFCSLCKVVYPSREEVTAHIERNHVEVQMFRCRQCLAVHFMKEVVEDHHRRSHRRVAKRLQPLCKNVISCIHCNLYFPSHEMMRSHIILMHPCSVSGNHFKCMKCHLVYIDQESAMAHECANHPVASPLLQDSAAQCRAQQMLPNSPGSKRSPARALKSPPRDYCVDAKRGYFFCNTCCIAYYKESSFRLHQDLHRSTDGGPFQCETCGELFQREFDKLVHVRDHLMSKAALCEACGEYLASEELLTIHKKSCALSREYGKDENFDVAEVEQNGGMNPVRVASMSDEEEEDVEIEVVDYIASDDEVSERDSSGSSGTERIGQTDEPDVDGLTFTAVTDDQMDVESEGPDGTDWGANQSNGSVVANVIEDEKTEVESLRGGEEAPGAAGKRAVQSDGFVVGKVVEEERTDMVSAEGECDGRGEAVELAEKQCILDRNLLENIEGEKPTGNFRIDELNTVKEDGAETDKCSEMDINKNEGRMNYEREVDIEGNDIGPTESAHEGVACAANDCENSKIESMCVAGSKIIEKIPDEGADEETPKIDQSFEEQSSDESALKIDESFESSEIDLEETGTVQPKQKEVIGNDVEKDSNSVEDLDAFKKYFESEIVEAEDRGVKSVGSCETAKEELPVNRAAEHTENNVAKVYNRKEVEQRSYDECEVIQIDSDDDDYDHSYYKNVVVNRDDDSASDEGDWDRPPGDMYEKQVFDINYVIFGDSVPFGESGVHQENTAMESVGEKNEVQLNGTLKQERVSFTENGSCQEDTKVELEVILDDEEEKVKVSDPSNKETTPVEENMKTCEQGERKREEKTVGAAEEEIMLVKKVDVICEKMKEEFAVAEGEKVETGVSNLLIGEVVSLAEGNRICEKADEIEGEKLLEVEKKEEVEVGEAMASDENYEAPREVGRGGDGMFEEDSGENVIAEASEDEDERRSAEEEDDESGEGKVEETGGKICAEGDMRVADTAKVETSNEVRQEEEEEEEVFADERGDKVVAGTSEEFLSVYDEGDDESEGNEALVEESEDRSLKRPEEVVPVFKESKIRENVVKREGKRLEVEEKDAAKTERSRGVDNEACQEDGIAGDICIGNEKEAVNSSVRYYEMGKIVLEMEILDGEEGGGGLLIGDETCEENVEVGKGTFVCEVGEDGEKRVVFKPHENNEGREEEVGCGRAKEEVCGGGEDQEVLSLERNEQKTWEEDDETREVMFFADEEEGILAATAEGVDDCDSNKKDKNTEDSLAEEKGGNEEDAGTSEVKTFGKGTPGLQQQERNKDFIDYFEKVAVRYTSGSETALSEERGVQSCEERREGVEGDDGGDPDSVRTLGEEITSGNNCEDVYSSDCEKSGEQYVNGEVGKVGEEELVASGREEENTFVTVNQEEDCAVTKQEKSRTRRSGRASVLEMLRIDMVDYGKSKRCTDDEEEEDKETDVKEGMVLRKRLTTRSWNELVPRRSESRSMRAKSVPLDDSYSLRPVSPHPNARWVRAKSMSKENSFSSRPLSPQPSSKSFCKDDLLSSRTGSSRPRGRPRHSPQPISPRPRGRPKQSDRSTPQPVTPRPRGRPKQSDRSTPQPVTPRPRGHPKQSDRSTPQPVTPRPRGHPKQSDRSTPQPVTPRPRGRPKQSDRSTPQPVTPRPRGRPKLSKNSSENDSSSPRPVTANRGSYQKRSRSRDKSNLPTKKHRKVQDVMSPTYKGAGFKKSPGGPQTRATDKQLRSGKKREFDPKVVREMESALEVGKRIRKTKIC